MWVFRFASYGNHSRKARREFNLNLITTTPNVIYEVLLRDGSKVKINTPSQMPSTGDIDKILEPMVSAEILAPKEFIGSIMTLCQKKRGVYKNTNYLSPEKAQIYYDLPLGEIIFDFYDSLNLFQKVTPLLIMNLRSLYLPISKG